MSVARAGFVMKRLSFDSIEKSYRQWEALHRICGGPESQARLEQLGYEMTQWPHSQGASARAEVETAFFLIQAGFSISFLEASGGRTADLECYDEGHRFFVEITLIQSTLGSQRDQDFRALEGIGDDFFEQALVKRLMARMAEKSKQLERYCAPVILAVSVPDLTRKNIRSPKVRPLDLPRIAGLVVGILAEIPQFSGFLLTFWNAPAQESRNPIRIKQVSWVTRPLGIPEHPRIRLWAINAFAKYPLTARECERIERAL